MGPRLSIVAGLAVGVIAALALLAGFLFVGPDPGIALRASASPSASDSPPASPSLSPSVATASASASPTPSVSGDTVNFHVGEPAPPLTVAQVGGGSISLTGLKGKPVWVNFMQTTCAPCIDEFPLMNGFFARYADKGLVVVAIDIREDEGAVGAFAQRLSATFPMGLDSNGEAQKAWGAYGLPVHFWIDKDGIVRDGALGGIGPDVMVRGLGKILPGVKVTP
jgi:thiol-disulfide isomerase/thioredoxin